ARWETRRLDAHRTRLTAALAPRRAGSALPDLTALCDTHPLDEPLQTLRLRALRDTGRTAQALAAYEEVLRLLADRAEAAARRAGVPMGEHRRYTPHLTVARSRSDVDVRPYVDVLGTFAGRTWTVADLVLVRSNLPTSGVPGEQPRYEAVGRWPLGAAG
uniref:BTAD domain-containing putative transcriptional regulator n=1 Tax=Streptomyces scabiei TaxID=1930 RepID=UPI0023E0B080